MTPLSLELATYRARLPELSASEGRFVLIHADAVEGVFETRAEALEAGFLAHGVKPFLVKRIEADEPIRYFTRDLG